MKGGRNKKIKEGGIANLQKRKKRGRIRLGLLSDGKPSYGRMHEGGWLLTIIFLSLHLSLFSLLDGLFSFHFFVFIFGGKETEAALASETL